MAQNETQIKEAFASFADDPSRVKFREFMRNHIGENRQSDFKEEWPNAVALAKDVLGIANSEGGIIVIGVKDLKNGCFEIVGVKEPQDPTKALDAIARFLPRPLQSELVPFSFDYRDAEYNTIKGKIFQGLIIPDLPAYLPFMAEGDGQSGKEKLARTQVYVRHSSSTRPATYEELQGMLTRRVRTGATTGDELTLDTHFEHLRTLYSNISPTRGGGIRLAFDPQSLLLMGGAYKRVPATPNPEYPSESIDQFIVRMIGAKKELIEEFLGVVGRTEEPRRSNLDRAALNHESDDIGNTT